MKSKKVLIVENNNLDRKLFESLIGQFYNFETVKNGIEAVNKASSEKFDLILMDIQMPEMDAITIFKTIRRQAEHQCPVIAVSNFSANSTRKCFLELGFEDLITKPIRPKEFLDLISDHLKDDSEVKSTFESTQEKPEVLDQVVLHQLLKYNSSETIKSIYADFMIEFDELIYQIDLSFQEKNPQNLYEYLHTLKGNSGTLGVTSIYNLSCDADIKARSQDWESLGILLKKLKTERAIFENYLREETTFKP